MRLKLLLMSILLCHLAIAQQPKKFCNYILPEFKEGTVYYKEGAVIRGQLNYNLLLNKMYILDQGKKKELSEIKEIEYVGLGQAKFVTLDEGDFGEIMTDGDKVILALHHEGSVVKTDNSAKGYSRNGLNKILDTGADIPTGVDIKVDSVYFLVRQEMPKGWGLAVERVETASYRGYTKIFSDHKAAIDQYIKEKNINFKKLTDLTALTLFCEGLGK